MEPDNQFERRKNQCVKKKQNLKNFPEENSLSARGKRPVASLPALRFCRDLHPMPMPFGRTMIFVNFQKYDSSWNFTLNSVPDAGVAKLHVPSFMKGMQGQQTEIILQQNP
jgi:hypothetical protein